VSSWQYDSIAISCASHCGPPARPPFSPAPAGLHFSVSHSPLVSRSPCSRPSRWPQGSGAAARRPRCVRGKAGRTRVRWELSNRVSCLCFWRDRRRKRWERKRSVGAHLAAQRCSVVVRRNVERLHPAADARQRRNAVGLAQVALRFDETFGVSTRSRAARASLLRLRSRTSGTSRSLASCCRSPSRPMSAGSGAAQGCSHLPGVACERFFTHTRRSALCRGTTPAESVCPATRSSPARSGGGAAGSAPSAKRRAKSASVAALITARPRRREPGRGARADNVAELARCTRGEALRLSL